MNWGSYFFSFQGRINRAKLWLFIPIMIGIYIVYFILFSILFGSSLVAMLKGGATGLAAGGASIGAGMLLTCLLSIAIIGASIALTVKRLHDRDKGAVWLLVFWLLPFILNIAAVINRLAAMSAGEEASPVLGVLSLISFAISIWAFVELYCLRGTVGDNRYGPDPLALPQNAF